MIIAIIFFIIRMIGSGMTGYYCGKYMGKHNIPFSIGLLLIISLSFFWNALFYYIQKQVAL